MERKEIYKTDEHAKEPVKVKNRDIPVLVNILSVMQLINVTERRRDWQKERLYNITQHLTGMPHSGQLPTGFDAVFAAMSELDKEHEAECSQYVHELRTAQRILNRIESRTMRAFVTLKYVMDVPDTDIMRELGMTKHGFYRAKNTVESAENMERVIWREKFILENDKEF